MWVYSILSEYFQIFIFVNAVYARGPYLFTTALKA